ncbi:hypothetical protein BAY61_05180 [Prauserella marina]|uniref:Ser/Thr protein kinase RdoA involved in Cpx stress response, MazF antagonist n=1 Tax=Prauserella marina TaxID=530584 RepID=A0A222VL94_9PSEU|nr:hypothetical protein [Prauserella marina]ASR34481.1 hypothetical protein BAY61_05180 [Prauserella marina]PWV85922.1 Ser/Thr protein kinase RdoA (MazF antagonist) [Prauserella marina]SDC42253.1 Ser/Thr protein kinase RdoA involved in Cpx stress response, MazF antagonist [Prauserella marina]
MGRDIAARLPRLLRAWSFPSVRVESELTDLGDRARVWRIHAGGRNHVAKLTFDAREFVEPGLLIAAALDRAGIRTGAPVPTGDGALSVSVRRGSWTLAVLEFVDGAPFDWAAPESGGDLLGRVHTILREAIEVPPAGGLLDFYATEADRVGGSSGAALAEALAGIHEFDRLTGLSHGVLYGDPAPEVLRDADTGELALIDWGAPSRGPLLHDLVCWQRFAEQARPGEPGMADRLLSGYLAQVPLTEAELAATGLFGTLHKAIRACWEQDR